MTISVAPSVLSAEGSHEGSGTKTNDIRRYRMDTLESLIKMVVSAGVFLGIWILPGLAAAHCDTLGGPVVETARQALEKGDVTPVLKWVRKEDEGEIRRMFEKALVARKAAPEARELADMYFYETLVRIHRAGEGAPYTGLKPAGEVEPAVEEADRAIDEESVKGLLAKLTHAVEEGVTVRYERLMAARKHMDESVAAGREYVEAYVDFTHYVERIHENATAHGSHHGEAREAPQGHGH